MHIDITEIVADFPEFRASVLVARELAVSPARPQGLEEEIVRREDECRACWAGRELSEIPGIAVWRRAYRAFGIKRNSYRSAVERLLKNALAGRELARINSFVDAYNAVSLSHVLPLGADDLDKVAGDLCFRYAREGDSFLDLAGEGEGGEAAPPKPGEVVYADDEKVLCRRWNWRQDARSLVSEQTQHAIITLQSNGWGDEKAAAEDLADLLARHCGAETTIFHLSAQAPRCTLAD
jgi:DNA/RNA-binding domain of Phe-tRNA-synthetase-like protein